MKTFTLSYDIEFIKGNLKGLTHTCTLPYPESSCERVKKSFQKDVDTRRIIRSTSGNQYIITTFRVIEND